MSIFGKLIVLDLAKRPILFHPELCGKETIMAQYCDSQKLERNWFHWLLSSRVPALEQYRTLGLLWTKVIGVATDDEGSPLQRHGKALPNPSYPTRAHCIALATPIYFNSHNGEPQDFGTVFQDGKPFRQFLPPTDILNLLSDDPLHRLEDPLTQITDIIPSLENRGYIRELPTTITWHAMLEDINRICHGIATKFKPRNEEEHAELTGEAAIQVINKLANYKLVYTPGRAPVFNLLTTTIHRILYSIMNRRKHQREGLGRIMADAEAGILPDSHRSLRVQSGHRKTIKSR